MLRFLLPVALTALPLVAQTALVRVALNSPADVAILAAMDLDLFGESLTPEVLIHHPSELTRLTNAGFQIELIEPDLEAFYAGRLAHFGRTDALAPPFAQGGMGGYFTYSEMVLFMDALQALFPSIMAPKVSLGLSLGGEQIWMWKVSDFALLDEPEPEILIDGLHHAREPISMQAAVYFCMRLLAGYDNDPTMTTLVNNREFFFVPIVNPDGYLFNEASHPLGGGLWRKNRRNNGDGTFGVDLNRNYGFQWGFDNVGSSPATFSETYRGQAAFSEPCTQAMRDFAESRDLHFGISLHSFGRMVFFPPGYAANTYPPPLLRVQYETIAQDLVTLPPGFDAGYAWNIFAPANGTTEDWWYGSLYGGETVFAFSLELGESTDGFWPATNRITPICEDSLHYLIQLSKSAGADFRLSDFSLVEIGGILPGVMEPGEILEIYPHVRNGGTVGEEATLEIASVQGPIQILTNTTMTPPIDPFSGTVGAAPLRVQIAQNASPASEFRILVRVRGQTSVPSERAVEGAVLLTPATLMGDTFEGQPTWISGAQGDTATSNGQGAWIQDDPNGTTLLSQLHNPENDHTGLSGTHCWFTGQAPVGGTANSADVDGSTTLTSPIFDASHLHAARISYWRWLMSTDNDPLQVDISNDGGMNWSPVESLATSLPAWRHFEFRIEDVLPRTNAMRLRFRISDTPNNSVTEAGVDDFELTGFIPPVDLAIQGTPSLGSQLQLQLSTPYFQGADYLIGCSLSARTGIPLGSILVPLDPDWLFFGAYAAPSVFQGFTGTLSASGQAQSTIAIPSDPSLLGFSFLTAAVIAEQGTILASTGALWLVLQP